MTRRKRPISALGPARLLIGLGSLYIALGVAQAIHILAEGGSFTSAAIGVFLIGGFGLLILYGGHRLQHTDLHPAVYPRIVAWTLGGLGVMLVIMGLLEFSPAGGGIDRPLFAIPLGTGLGSVSGLAVGMNEAKAMSRAREAEQNSRELRRTQADLRETIERLEESNERLEQFAYAASHDLQEPLRMVQSYLQLIERRSDDELTEETREFLEFAVDGADRMRAMIDSLLTYSRIETGGDPFVPVDLDAVLEDALTDLQVKLDESDAEITAEPLPHVEGDGNQLRQVFQNLLDNAIEYSGDEPPRIHVAAERDGDKWVISVSDEGIGIDPKHSDQVFEVFQRLHTHDEHDGGGIGLAICERIIERHDGDIGVESHPGDGATFYFTLPHTDEEQKPRTPGKSPSRA